MSNVLSVTVEEQYSVASNADICRLCVLLGKDNDRPEAALYVHWQVGCDNGALAEALRSLADKLVPQSTLTK